MGGFRSSNALVRFGAFELDQKAGELRKDGARIRLQEQPLQVLQILLEHPGTIITREELQQKIWPTDTFVDFNHGINNAIKRLREALGDTADTPRYVETLPRRGYRFIAALENGADSRIKSLAVLPLANLSADPEQEYFVDGLTEALITNLAKISALRVASRTSAMQYKSVSDKSVREIARELGVDGIVEGTVLRSGDRVRISAQLIHAATDTHLWAEEYERDLRDILALQSDVARAIAREIRAKLTPEEQSRLAQTHPVDPNAYEAYLKGRYHLGRRSGESLQKARDCFQEAIDQDPKYAPGYAGLADALVLLNWWGFISPEQGSARAKSAAMKAVELDNTLAAPHACLGFAILHYEYDYEAADKEFRRAIELEPSYAVAHEWYAACLSAMGRLDESLDESKRALQLDPASPIVNTIHAVLLLFARRFDEAIAQARTTVDLDPTFPHGHWALGLAYEKTALHEEAIAEMEEAVKLSRSSAIFIASLGHVYASAGKRDNALRIVDELITRSRQHYVMAHWMAEIFACLNQRDEAFGWLERAYYERSAWSPYLKVYPVLDNLRSDPRYQELVRRMNFPS